MSHEETGKHVFKNILGTPTGGGNYEPTATGNEVLKVTEVLSISELEKFIVNSISDFNNNFTHS